MSLSCVLILIHGASCSGAIFVQACSLWYVWGIMTLGSSHMGIEERFMWVFAVSDLLDYSMMHIMRYKSRESIINKNSCSTTTIGFKISTSSGVR